MDFNSILNLLKDQNTKTPDNNVTQSTISLDNINLSNISQDVIKEVREEYLLKKQKQQENSLKNATSITPEVLVMLGTMMKETNLMQVLNSCKERQDKKERELFAHRESIKERYKKQRENILAKELIGVKIDPNELKSLERELNQELHRMDIQVLKDMDGEIKHLQQEFVKLNVPLFKVSNETNDIKLQQKVLSILQNMT